MAQRASCMGNVARLRFARGMFMHGRWRKYWNALTAIDIPNHVNPAAVKGDELRNWISLCHWQMTETYGPGSLDARPFSFSGQGQLTQKEKNTPIDSPAWFVVPANSAIMAVSKHTESMQPVRPVTIILSDILV
jgi:hypothetical protein